MKNRKKVALSVVLVLFFITLSTSIMPVFANDYVCACIQDWYFYKGETEKRSLECYNEIKSLEDERRSLLNRASEIDHEVAMLCISEAYNLSIFDYANAAIDAAAIVALAAEKVYILESRIPGLDRYIAEKWDFLSYLESKITGYVYLIANHDTDNCIYRFDLYN